MFLAWSAGACLLAYFAWRRQSWARWLLVACAAGAAVASVFAFPVSVVHITACAVAIGALLSRPAGLWFAARPGGRPPLGPPPPPVGTSAGPPPGPGGRPRVW
jgi:hypothetical protein